MSCQYDFGTTNESFIKIYEYLRDNGIKNNKFMLLLLDEDLQGLDPYSPNLSEEQKMKIFIECKNNPWYFLREVFRFSEAQTNRPNEVIIVARDPYELDKHNVATWYLFINGIDHYSCKPRQLRNIQDAIAKCTYSNLFGKAVSLIGKYKADSYNYSMHMRAQQTGLPYWWDNISMINSDVYIAPRAYSKRGAMKIVNSITSPVQCFIDFDFISFNTKILANTKYDNSGEKCCRILTGMPGNLNTPEGVNAYRFYKKMVKWNDNFYDMEISNLVRLIHINGYNGFINIETSWMELEKSYTWYQNMCRLLNNDYQLINSEINLYRASPLSQPVLPTYTTGMLPEYTNDLTREIDLYVIDKHLLTRHKTYIYKTENNSRTLALRFLGATRGHIEVDGAMRIKSIEFYDDACFVNTRCYLLSLEHGVLDKYIGKKIVFEN